MDSHRHDPAPTEVFAILVGKGLEEPAPRPGIRCWQAGGESLTNPGLVPQAHQHLLNHHALVRSTPSLGAGRGCSPLEKRWTTIPLAGNPRLLEVHDPRNLGPLFVAEETEARRRVTQAQGHPAGGGRQGENGTPASNFPGSRNFPAGQRPLSPALLTAPWAHRLWDLPQSLPPGVPATAGEGFQTSDPGPVATPRRLQRPAVPRTRRSGRKCHTFISFSLGTEPGVGRAVAWKPVRGRRPDLRSRTRGRVCRTHQVVHRVWPACGPASPQGRTPSCPRRAPSGPREGRSRPGPGLGPAASATTPAAATTAQRRFHLAPPAAAVAASAPRRSPAPSMPGRASPLATVASHANEPPASPGGAGARRPVEPPLTPPPPRTRS